MTCIKKEEDIKPIYKLLVDCLNESWYDNKLYGDPSLFLKEEEVWKDEDLIYENQEDYFKNHSKK